MCLFIGIVMYVYTRTYLGMYATLRWCASTCAPRRHVCTYMHRAVVCVDLRPVEVQVLVLRVD